MSLRKQFGTNPDKVAKGVPFEVGYNDDKTRPTFILGRMHASNPEYQKVDERIMAPARKIWAAVGKINDKEAEALSRQTFAEGGILGWSNVLWTDVDPAYTGGEVYAPYTPENALKLLEALPELYDTLVGASMDRSRYQDTNPEADVKN